MSAENNKTPTNELKRFHGKPTILPNKAQAVNKRREHYFRERQQNTGPKTENLPNFAKKLDEEIVALWRDVTKSQVPRIQSKGEDTRKQASITNPTIIVQQHQGGTPTKGGQNPAGL